MAISFKGAHFPQDIILMGVRWYVAYPLSYRHVEELMQERGVPVDHATIQRWVVKYSPCWRSTSHATSIRHLVNQNIDSEIVTLSNKGHGSQEGLPPSSRRVRSSGAVGLAFAAIGSVE